MYAHIIIDITNEAVDKAYTYIIPDDLEVNVGDCVEIPFGSSNKVKRGYIIDITNTSEYPSSKLKQVLSVSEKSVSVQEQLISLAVWMSREYGTILNQCLKTVLPVKRAVGKNKRRTDPLDFYEGESDELHELNAEQRSASDSVIKALDEDRAGQAERFLLYGITGSGKTEVYLHIMEDTLKRGKKIILLIPEISLTYQTVRRVSSRFKGRVAIMNSKMSLGERYDQYKKCESGEVDILIGPRSAAFAPFENLGLIIMDEEHEGAYKSDTAPRYDTRDVIYERAKMSGCPVVYGSATPSLDIYRETELGHVKLLKLTERAKSGSRLPSTEIVDLREELKNGNRSIFSDRLKALIKEKLTKKEQIMLFMNRRGYANFMNCRSCGESVKCPHCDVTLTLHKDGMLRCHYCGYEIPVMKKCPSCGSPYLAPFGFGTEKLETLVHQEFPESRVLRMDKDTTRLKGGHESILQDFRNHKADILIGTQMIVKGHDFPDVTLVGLILADLSLSAPDFKAQERTFQLITQAAGRAGRDKEPGQVIIQTYQPDHYAIELASKQDYMGFYNKEMVFRKLMGYPPYEKLLTIQLQCMDENYLSEMSKLCVEKLTPKCTADSVEIIGPLNATVYRVKDVYRKIVYIKHDSHDIILRFRDEYIRLLRTLDKRGLILPGFDLQ